MFARIRHGLGQLEHDFRPLYRALEPFVIFGVVVVAIGLQALIPDKIASDTHWIALVIECAALAALIIVTELEHRQMVRRGAARIASIALILVMALATAFTLYTVLDRLLTGQVHDGRELVFAGMKLWGTLVIVFALCYWELDRGGPSARNHDEGQLKHLSFPQDQDPETVDRPWAPTFLDYLYVSLTNSTAFSPTDTMPLTHAAKVIMAMQSVLSLATIGIVFSRAVNIL